MAKKKQVPRAKKHRPPVSAREAALYLGLPLLRLYRLAAAGALPRVELGQKQVMFDLDALDSFIARGGERIGKQAVAR